MPTAGDPRKSHPRFSTSDGLNRNGKLALSGFVEPCSDPVKNAELAKLRARAACDAFKAAGVAEDKIELQKPTDITAGSTSSAEGGAWKLACNSELLSS